jgi:hypothetical protein
LIDYGADYTSGRRNTGALPAACQWVRLEIPASSLGLEGGALNGISFMLVDGRATWDLTGRYSAGAQAP